MKKFNAQRKGDNFAKVGQGILDLLREPISRPEANPKFALPPTQPNEPYDKPLPTTQEYELQPFLHELMPIMRALDRFNIHAKMQLRAAEEEKEKLESDGRSKLPLVVARKRSASDAKLNKINERPPMKRSASGVARAEETPPMKRIVSFAQEEDVISIKRPESNIKPEVSSPTQRKEWPDRLTSPNSAAIKDPGPSHRDPKPSKDHESNRAARLPTTNGYSTINKDPSTDNNLSSSLNRNIHPSRVDTVEFALPTSPAKSRTIRDPRPSSKDPRLMNRKPSLNDR
jgi:hypothetical protein